LLFSEFFEVRKGQDDDWFDTILDADTELFVDPFLIFQDDTEEWRNAHNLLIEHFNFCFKLIAEGLLNPQSIQYKKAIDLLTFAEPLELCLGYTHSGTSGAGSGRGFARSMAKLIADSISRGVDNIEHFEILGIFEKGIGRDRISDIACTILKPQLINYTQKVAEAHNLPLAEHTVRSGAYDKRRSRWINARERLLTNSANQKPLLLVPQRFLQDLPTLNSDDWWEAFENEKLRTDMNYEVMRNVDKETIVKEARSRPNSVRNWSINKESETANPYEISYDPQGIYRWDPEAREFVQHNPLQLNPPQTEDQFLAIVQLVVDKFKLFVEEQGGWELLWDVSRHTPKEKPEKAAQLLFRGMARSYCEANNIVVDSEVELGRGPVDFKFSNGFLCRAHLEVKKLHNGKFWHGIEEQLPSYLASDEVKDGWFLVVRYRDGKTHDERAASLPRKIQEVAQKHSKELRYAAVDAREKPSASKA
jgi:hypothetical protein